MTDQFYWEHMIGIKRKKIVQVFLVPADWFINSVAKAWLDKAKIVRSTISGNVFKNHLEVKCGFFFFNNVEIIQDVFD